MGTGDAAVVLRLVVCIDMQPSVCLKDDIIDGALRRSISILEDGKLTFISTSHIVDYVS
jgi:hypothetical protein